VFSPPDKQKSLFRYLIQQATEKAKTYNYDFVSSAGKLALLL